VLGRPKEELEKGDLFYRNDIRLSGYLEVVSGKEVKV